MEWNFEEFKKFLNKNSPDGVIITFKSNSNRWSYSKTDSNDLVVRVEEKNPISKNANAGIYYFRKAEYFITNAENMINNNIKTKNEFYVSPVYNNLISSGKKILIFPVQKMITLGTPEDLNTFLEDQAK